MKAFDLLMVYAITVLKDEWYASRNDEILNLFPSRGIVHHIVGDQSAKVGKIDANQATCINQRQNVSISSEPRVGAIEVSSRNFRLASFYRRDWVPN